MKRRNENDVNCGSTASNPVEAPKIFFSGSIHNFLNCDYDCDGHIFSSNIALLGKSYFVTVFRDFRLVLIGAK